mgnify:CR=1 FL=1
MANQNAKGLQRLINACFFSLAGFKATWQHEEAFRQEVALRSEEHTSELQSQR